MPSMSSFALSAGLPVEELRTLSQAQVVNPESQLYKSIVAKLGDKWSEAVKDRTANKTKKRTRVYVPYALSSVQKYRLASGFPQFDIKYIGLTDASAPMARAVSLLVSERMLTMAGKAGGKSVVCLGYQLRPALMRNRSWVRVLALGANPRVQAEYMQEDRQLASMFNAMLYQKKKAPPAMTQYMTGRSDVFASDVFGNLPQTDVSCIMLDAVDTNFMQLAEFAKACGNRQLIFAIPAHKNMEFFSDGPMPQLEGYVVAREGKVSLIFEGDCDFQRSYDHRNYLELIARSQLELDGEIFMKEFVEITMGYAIYKVTRFPKTFDDPPPVYRSWYEPAYRNKYILRVPQLVMGSSSHRESDWVTTTHVVDKAIVDETIAMALSNSDKKIDAVIGRRINSKAHNYIANNQLARRECPLSVEALSAAITMVYADTFMRKFLAGAAVSTLAPQARESATLARKGLMSLLGTTASVYFKSMVASVSSAAANMLPRDEAQDHLLGFMPVLQECKGYVEYNEGVSGNESFVGWSRSWQGEGFSPYLPSKVGAGYRELLSVIAQPAKAGVLPARSEPTDGMARAMDAMIPGWSDTQSPLGGAVGDAMQDVSSGQSRSQDGVTPSVVGRKLGDFSAFISDIFYDPFEPLDEVGLDAGGPSRERTDTVHLAAQHEVLGGRTAVAAGNELTYAGRYTQLDLGCDPASFEEDADELVSKVMMEHGRRHKPPQTRIVNAHLMPSVVIDKVAGVVSDSPVEDMMKAIGDAFPLSQVMDVTYLEAARADADISVIMRCLRMKIDMSKMESLKPESFFNPVMRTHLLPHVRETTGTVLQTLEKRNANTPYVVDPVDREMMWKSVWNAMLDVIFVPGTESYLERAEALDCDEASVREWIARQDGDKVAKLLGYDDFSLEDIARDASNMSLLLKSKLKPELDPGYETGIKLPQSVQFDASGRSVLVLSPILRQKVKRCQLLYRPNVFVMQSKSPDDLVNFLNAFDWRANPLGERWYIEIDETMFDKSQSDRNAWLYRQILLKMGVPREYVDFIENCMENRSVSSQKAGVKINLRDQNPSGAAFTLDRNNEVSLCAVAELLATLGVHLEFVLIMGDDVTVAVRGKPNVAGWERDMARKHNLNPKVAVQKHGHFCSFDLVHLPEGRTTVVRNVFKAALAFSEPDLKDGELLYERWLSYLDSMRDVDDLNVQLYLSDALPKRMAKTHPGVTAETVMCAVKAHASCKQSFTAYKSFFTDVPTTRYY